MGFAACPCRSLSTCRRPPVPSHAACQHSAWSRRQFFRAFAERRRSTMCPSCDIVPWEIGRSTRTLEQLSSCCARFVVSSCSFGHIGHSMGGMIAAEMACVARHDLAKLVLASPAGLWIAPTSRTWRRSRSSTSAARASRHGGQDPVPAPEPSALGLSDRAGPLRCRRYVESRDRRDARRHRRQAPRLEGRRGLQCPGRYPPSAVFGHFAWASSQSRDCST